MKKTNLDLYIENEIKNDPSLEGRLQRVHKAIDISIQIYSLRKERGLTQSQLAKLAHVRQSNISRLENADYEGYSKKTLEKIAEALDVDLAIFLVPKKNIDFINSLLEITSTNITQLTVFPGINYQWGTASFSCSGPLEEHYEDNNDAITIQKSGSMNDNSFTFNFI